MIGRPTPIYTLLGLEPSRPIDSLNLPFKKLAFREIVCLAAREHETQNKALVNIHVVNLSYSSVNKSYRLTD